MSDLPPDVRKRRDVEDRAIRLGAERNDLEHRLAKNTEEVIDLIPEASDTGITFDSLAAMVGVSRQTLHRWREVIRRLREAKEDETEL